MLAQNLNRMMEQRYKERSNRPMALAKDAGVSLSTVQRVLSREAGASIDTLEAFAGVFGLPPFQMIVPWGMLGEIAVAQQQREPLASVRKRASQAAPRRTGRVRDRKVG